MTDQLVVPSFSLLKYDNPVAAREPSSGKRKVSSFFDELQFESKLLSGF